MNTTQTLILLTGSALIALELTPPPSAPSAAALTPAPLQQINSTMATARRLERKLERLHEHAGALEPIHTHTEGGVMCVDKTPPAEPAPLMLSR